MLDTERAIDLVKAIIRAKKNLRLYPENNPIYKKTVDDIYFTMSSMLETEESIIFKFKQYDIIYDKEIVYHNKNKDESLALFFFKDGLRELTFLKGITRTEVKEFSRMISLDFEKEIVDDDIVTLMWECDFKFIKYVVDDACLLEDENYEYVAVERAKKTVADHDQIIKAYEDALRSERISDIKALSLTDNDIKSIAQVIEDDPADKSGLLIHMLFEMIFFARDKEEYKEITEIIKQALIHATTNANIEVVNSVLSRIKSALKICVYPEKVNPYLEVIDDYVNSSDFIKLFGEVIERGGTISAEVISEFSSLLNKDSIPHYMALLGEMQNIASRRTVINILSVVGQKNIPLIAIGLNDRRWYVVRNVIYILRKIRDRVSVEYLTGVLSHSDRRVRKEAVLALGEMGSKDVFAILKKCMSDEDTVVRIAACRAIAQLDTPESKQMIFDYIRNKKFRDKSFSEKKAVVGVLSRWKEADVVEFLTRIVKKKNLFNRAKNNETRAAAVNCLGLIAACDAGILEKLKRSNNPLVRNSMPAALKKIKHGTV